MTEKRPELAFLDTIAAAIINANHIESMAFVLQHASTKRPYIVWYGKADAELVVAMSADLVRIERLRQKTDEELGLPVETNEPPPFIRCGAFGGACTLEAKHDGYHLDVEGMYFDDEGRLVN